jgi:PAS domain S-box-containing protein
MSGTDCYAPAGTRILIVEDEAIIAMDLKAHLTRMGYSVAAVAATGEQALRLASELQPDLVLMDIVLKGAWDGVHTAEKLREGLQLPVIYLTAHSDEQTLQRAKLTGPFGYIIKPFEDRELRTAIEMGLYRHNMEARLRASEARFRAYIENASDIIITTDADGVIVYASPSVERVLGYAPVSLAGQNALGFMHEEDLARAVQWADSFVNAMGGHNPSLELRVRHHDQTWRVLEVVASNLLAEPSVRGIVVNARDITERKLADQELLRHQRAIAMLQERDRLGRELHDSVGQLLGCVKFQAEAARILLSQNQIGQADALLLEMGEIAQNAQMDVREQILGLSLRPQGMRQPGFLRALQGYLQEFSRHNSLEIDFAAEPELEQVQMEVGAETHLIRIVQEALANVKKHAGARHVSVTFQAVNSHIRGVIRDDGQGFDLVQARAQDGWHFGLQVMRERAHEIGGTLDIESVPGQGTCVTVVVPRGANLRSS